MKPQLQERQDEISPVAVSPFRHTSRISFTLSNICNMAAMHPKCPANLEMKHKQILPAKVVLESAKIALENGFKGTFAFHTYNEPTHDPRLCLFVHQIQQLALQFDSQFAPKDLDFFLLTNGFYLTDIICAELFETGFTSIQVSAYGKKEYDRLVAVSADPRYTVVQQSLDMRMDLYESPYIDLAKPCHAPLNEIIVHADGSVGLCCLDWKKKHVFGNLNTESLADIVTKPEMLAVYDKLSSGCRNLDMCRRCNWSR